MSRLGLSVVFAAALLLPATVDAQPTKVQPTKAIPAKVQPTAKVVVSVPASMAHVTVPTSQPVVTPVVTPAVAPVKPDDVQGVANTIKGAMRSSNWRLAVIAGLLLTVLLLRRIGGFFLPAKAGSWVNSDRGGAFLALMAGVLTVGVNGLVAGGGFNSQLLIDGVLAAATTAGSFNLINRLAAPSDLPVPPPAPAPQTDEPHGGSL